MKKLYRSRNDKKLCGLLGGLGEYFDVDANLLRLLFILVCFITGFFPLLIAYIVACIIIPEAPEVPSSSEPGS